MVRSVDTLVICDGGRKDRYGFDAAYIPVQGIPMIGYSIKVGVESKYIRKIYIYSDLEEQVLETAKKMYPDHSKLITITAEEEMPTLKEHQKVLRILSAETKLVMSISKTFYRHIVNDISWLREFSDDWRDFNDIQAYQRRNPGVRELPVAFMGNDQPLCRAIDLDDMIEAYDQDLFDSLLGYTKRVVLDEYLARAGVSIKSFHRTLAINDFIDGSWMRHNCLFILKWGKMDDRLLEVVSFYNQHRIQSKLSNFVLVLLKIICKYYGKSPEIAAVLRMAAIFAIEKYFKSFHIPGLRDFVTRNVNRDTILECSRRLGGHRISIFSNGSARSVIDVDDPKDIAPILGLLSVYGEDR